MLWYSAKSDSFCLIITSSCWVRPEDTSQAKGKTLWCAGSRLDRLSSSSSSTAIYTSSSSSTSQIVSIHCLNQCSVLLCTLNWSWFDHIIGNKCEHFWAVVWKRWQLLWLFNFCLLVTAFNSNTSAKCVSVSGNVFRVPEICKWCFNFSVFKVLQKEWFIQQMGLSLWEFGSEDWQLCNRWKQHVER